MTQPQRCDIDASRGRRRAKDYEGACRAEDRLWRAYACMWRGIAGSWHVTTLGISKRVRSWMVWWCQRDELMVTWHRYDAP